MVKEERGKGEGRRRRGGGGGGGRRFFIDVCYCLVLSLPVRSVSRLLGIARRWGKRHQRRTAG